MNGSHALYEFEADERLELLPLAARRALDQAGAKLSLGGWESLPMADRWALIDAGAEAQVDAAHVCALAARATPPPATIPAREEPSASEVPQILLDTLGPRRPLAAALWAALRPLDRYSLAKAAQSGKIERLGFLYEEIVAARAAPRLTHLTESGAAHMVDVGGKATTARRAVASARVRMQSATLELLLNRGVEKGDAFAVARVAGIQAAKKTPELIPLCHAVHLTRVEVDFEPDRASSEVRIVVSSEAQDRTGVEMEALVGASVAALTLYDMIKGIDRWASIGEVRLDEKSGGKSGAVARPAAR